MNQMKDKKSTDYSKKVEQHDHKHEDGEGGHTHAVPHHGHSNGKKHSKYDHCPICVRGDVKVRNYLSKFDPMDDYNGCHEPV